MRLLLACAESRIDALQRKFPTVGRKPFERGGTGEQGEDDQFKIRGFLNFDQELRVVRLLGWSLSTR